MGRITVDEIKKILATGSYVEKISTLSHLADLFEYPRPDTTGFNELFRFLIDFVVESDDDKLKQEAFDAIEMAQGAPQDMSNVDFSKIEENIGNASPNTLSRFVDVLGFTQDIKYLPTILKYENHEDPVVREAVYDALVELRVIEHE